MLILNIIIYFSKILVINIPFKILLEIKYIKINAKRKKSLINFF